MTDTSEQTDPRETEAKKFVFEQALALQVSSLGGSQDGGRKLESGEVVYPVYVPPMRAQEFKQFLSSQGYECEGDGPGETATFASEKGSYVSELIPRQKFVPNSEDSYFFRITGKF